MARIVAAAVSAVVALALLQALIDATPMQLIPDHHGEPAARSYRLTQVGPRSAVLTLYGARPGLSVSLVPVASVMTSYRLTSSTPAVPSLSDVTVVHLKLQGPPATYKLVMPGVQPFGLVSVGSRGTAG